MTFQRWAACLFSLLLFTGCKSEIYRGPQGPFGNQCAPYSFQDGTTTQLYVEDIISTYFDKQFDQGHLNAILTSSAKNTVDYVRKLNLGLYKTKRDPNNNCDFFAGLPQASWNLSVLSQIPGGSYIGVYFPRQYPGLTEAQLQSVIVLAEETDRWTLVHEFMHHLFNKGRNDRSQWLKERYVEVSEQISRLPETMDPATIEHGMFLALEYARIIDELMLVYPLEEIAIETILTELYLDKSLTYVPNSIENATAYIEKSATASQTFYVEVVELMERLLAEGNRVLGSQDFSRLQLALSPIDQLLRNRGLERSELVSLAINRLDKTSQLNLHNPRQHEGHSCQRLDELKILRSN